MAISIPQYKHLYKQDVVFMEDIPEMSPFHYHLPDPPNLNEIANNRLPGHEQFWQRYPMPKGLYNMQLTLPRDELIRELFVNKKKYKEEWAFMDEQWHRIMKGFFVFIGGQIEWLPPQYYFYLNNWRMDGGRYPQIRFPDKDLFVFMHAAKMDQYCLGVVEITKLRDGKSFRGAAIAYHESITGYGKQIGIQSKSEADANELFNDKIVQPWRYLPFYYQPVCSNSTNPVSELRWFKPSAKGSNAMNEAIGERQELGGWISARHAGELAFGSIKLHFLLQDEVGKTKPKEANVYDRWLANRKRVTDDGKKIGWTLQTSTVEDLIKFGGENLRMIWNESDHTQVTSTGTTKSMLWRWYKPAYVGYERDIYGRSVNEKQVAERIKAQRKLYENNTEKMVQLIRQESLTPREAFAYVGGSTPFDIVILQNRMSELENMKNAVRVGNFEWVDNQPAGIWDGDPERLFRKGHVEWVDDPNGRACVSYLFEDDKFSNKYFFEMLEDSSGFERMVAIPSNADKFVAGGDPFKYRKSAMKQKLNAADTSGWSLGGGAIFWKYDTSVDVPGLPIHQWKSNRFIYDYLYRPATPDLYAEDMLKACVYYGAMMFPEINVELLWEYFEKRGFGGFLLHQLTSNGKYDHRPGMHTSPAVQEDIFKMYHNYISKHGMRERHIRILKQCFEIGSPEYCGEYDLFMAGGYALMATKRVFVPEGSEEKIDIGSIVQQYEYRNGKSHAL